MKVRILPTLKLLRHMTWSDKWEGFKLTDWTFNGFFSSFCFQKYAFGSTKFYGQRKYASHTQQNQTRQWKPVIISMKKINIIGDNQHAYHHTNFSPLISKYSAFLRLIIDTHTYKFRPYVKWGVSAKVIINTLIKCIKKSWHHQINYLWWHRKKLMNKKRASPFFDEIFLFFRLLLLRCCIYCFPIDCFRCRKL